MKKFLLLGLLTLAVPQLDAKLITKAVAYEHQGTKLKGYLAYDDEKVVPGKTPGVLLIHEWWGLNATTKAHADRVAAMGYIAFAADMFGTTADDPKKAGELAGQFYGKPLMAERADAGLQQLRKVEYVDPTKLAAIGFCFGGSTVQALAYSGASVAGIVSFHGSPVPAPASVKGMIKTPFLLLNGAIDPMVLPAARAEHEASLEAAQIDYQSVDYAGAVHAFTNPTADKVAAEHGLVGKIGYNEIAARRSWQQTALFFSEIFDTRK